MGQQPNMPLRLEDLPRPTPKTDPPRRWSPRRPGDLDSPEAVPWGGAFGTPGPDTGYALKLAASRQLDLAEGESRTDAEAALAGIAAARSSHFGRAPVVGDLDVAEVILGFGSGADVGWRHGRIAGAAHHPKRVLELVAAVDPEALVADLDEVKARVGSGERLVAE